MCLSYFQLIPGIAVVVLCGIELLCFLSIRYKLLDKSLEIRFNGSDRDAMS